MLDRFLKKLSSAEREVTLCYAAVDGLTWAQAAFRAGKLAEMGERVRRKLKRLLIEGHRRRPGPTDP